MALRKNKDKDNKAPVEEVKSEMTEAVEELSEAVSEVVDGLKKKATAAAKKKATAAAKKKATAAAKEKIKAELKSRAVAEAAAREPEVVEAEVVEEEAEVVEEAPVPTLASPAAPPPAKTVSAKQLMQEMLYSDLENGFIAEFGTLPRIIASNGNFLDGDKKVLGTFITGQVLSWNKRFTITPSDDKAPDTLARFSMDNKTLDDGSGVTVAEYIQELKNNNYPDACSKEYYDVIFNLMTTDKPSAHVNNMVTLQMSPTSKKDFNSFRLQMSFKISNGMLDVEKTKVVKFTSVLVNGKTNTWTIFKGSLID